MSVAPGWYPDPSTGQPRFFDGQQWTSHVAPPMPVDQGQVVVQGPNHVLHAVLTLLTWPLCGGWAWVWLVVAASNKKTVRHVY